MADPIYYRKQGRRYIPVEQWVSEPAPGIWLVQEGSYRRFMRLGDLPTVMTAAALARHHSAICQAIMRQPRYGEGSSASEMADAIVLAVAAAEDREVGHG